MSATTVELDRSGSAAILRIAGDVTSASEPDLMAGYTRAAEGGAGVVVLDFSALEVPRAGGHVASGRMACLVGAALSMPSLFTPFDPFDRADRQYRATTVEP